MNWTQGDDSPPLLGRDVFVQWHNCWYDWHHYTVTGYCDGWILLRGRADDGVPFEGGDIMVPMSSIELIEVEARG